VRHGRVAPLAAEHPERVAGLVFIAPSLSATERQHGAHPFDPDPGTDEGWAKETRAYWERDWPGYLEFFFAKCLTEPHSTKQLEDCVGWAMDTDMETSWPGSVAGRPRSSTRWRWPRSARWSAARCW
jgi:pimeloyl-ACP methyl ester carboxylesterase